MTSYTQRVFYPFASIKHSASLLHPLSNFTDQLRMLMEESNTIPFEKRLIRWLCLQKLPQIGPVTLRQWYEKLTFTQLFTPDLFNLSHLLKLNTSQYEVLKSSEKKGFAKIFKWLENDNHHVLTWGDPYYPAQLEQIHASPPVLFVKGNICALQHPQIAMVGSRAPSHTGLDAAYFFSKELAQAGFTVTSGLAIGIDGASHKGALKAKGYTLAVLGSGLSQLYPKRHDTLAQAIVGQQGALISEYLPDTPPCALHFPRRNRIISGLSLGTFVIEAGEKSGSLITARYAIEQNREVFVLPSVWHNTNSRGGHRLIQQGAKLICDLEDILEEVGMKKTPFEEQFCNHAVNTKSLPETVLLDNVDHEVTAVDVIAMRSNMSVDTALSQLFELELNGWVTAVPGGYMKTRRG